MGAPKMPRHMLQEAIDVLAKAGDNHVTAATAAGIPRGTFDNRVREAKRQGIKPSKGIEDNSNPAHLKAQIRRLKSELADTAVEAVDAEAIRTKIIGLKRGVADAEPPEWLGSARPPTGSPGVPTLFLSDLHWGEVVKPSQIMGKNVYNIAIAHERMETLVESAIHLLKIISPKMDYPGIVIPLGGDLVSGNIHEELTATNEMNTMPTVVDLYGVLVKVISQMADTFGRVFLPCVTGNHGRDTLKIWNKDRHHTSFDWLLCMFLAKHFENDKRIHFLIPDGPDALYKIYNHTYLLTHGDSYRGGDGLIGCLGPILRGDHKKRSRNAQIGLDYTTQIMGHWHSYIHHSRVIVNGSLKGLDEYAYNNNFPFEPPQQALWLTHPKYNITYRMPVMVDKKRGVPKTEWVSFVQ